MPSVLSPQQNTSPPGDQQLTWKHPDYFGSLILKGLTICPQGKTPTPGMSLLFLPASPQLAPLYPGTDRVLSQRPGFPQNVARVTNSDQYEEAVLL